MTAEKRIALLIDAENISAQYADNIMEEVANYGVCSYKRIYGSWERIVHTKWEKEINKNSLKAMMQIHNIKGKNATDSALIIDAMDILYNGNVDGFCIVSSDSDFTSLARRLAESGMMVIGMGESDKATEALENAYDKFVYIDMLAEQEDEQVEEGAGSDKAKKTKSSTKSGTSHPKANMNIPGKKDIENRIRQIIMENADKGKATNLGQIGNDLSHIYKNFDVRYYDKKGGGKYKYLRDFVGDFKGLEIWRDSEGRVFVNLAKQ